MPGYTDLTTIQKAQLDELLLTVRPLAAELYKFAQRNRVPLQLWFTPPADTATTLADLVAAFTAASLIPNQTDLSGADSVPKEGLQAVMGYISSIASHDSAAHLNVMLPFAGSQNFV